MAQAIAQLAVFGPQVASQLDSLRQLVTHASATSAHVTVQVLASAQSMAHPCATLVHVGWQWVELPQPRPQTWANMQARLHGWSGAVVQRGSWRVLPQQRDPVGHGV